MIVHFLEVVDLDGDLAAGFAVALLAAADHDFDAGVGIRRVVQAGQHVALGQGALGTVRKIRGDGIRDDEGAVVGIERVGNDFRSSGWRSDRAIGVRGGSIRSGRRGRCCGWSLRRLRAALLRSLLLGEDFRLHFVGDGLFDFGSEDDLTAATTALIVLGHLLATTAVLRGVIGVGCGSVRIGRCGVGVGCGCVVVGGYCSAGGSGCGVSGLQVRGDDVIG